MNRVSVDLRNCYGIKTLKHNFDFQRTSAIALYAANGVMKSSLAETLHDASLNRKSEDRIFRDREASRHIIDETGAEISGERVLVVRSYDADYSPTEKTSTLLVSANLRKESEKLEKQVEVSKDALLRALRTQANSKRDFAGELSMAIFRRSGQFEEAAISLQRLVERQEDAPFADVKYDIVFNEKVLKALEDQNIMDAIKDFVSRYNELLARSNYFRKGTFDYYNAGQIAKSLTSQGFFKANHTVNLYSSGAPVEVKDQRELLKIIDAEKSAILNDTALQKRFNAVQTNWKPTSIYVNSICIYKIMRRCCREWTTLRLSDKTSYAPI